MSEVALWRSVIANAIAEARGEIIGRQTKGQRLATPVKFPFCSCHRL